MNLYRSVFRILARHPRLFVAAWILAFAAVNPRAAAAEDWMFARSYFSHDIPPQMAHLYPQPESRSAYRPAYTGEQPGFSARGAYRFRVLQMNSGSSRDTTIFREQWLNTRVFP